MHFMSSVRRNLAESIILSYENLTNKYNLSLRKCTRSYSVLKRHQKISKRK